MSLDPVHKLIISQIWVNKLTVGIGNQDDISGADFEVGYGSYNFHDGVPAGDFFGNRQFGSEIEKFENRVFFELAVVDGFPDHSFAFRGFVEDTDDYNGCGVAKLPGVKIVAVAAEAEAVEKIRMLHLW